MHDLTRLFYIHDPMCSWCYAFTESWRKLQQALPADIQVVYVLGGLAPDTHEPMPDEMRNMIQHTWQKIEKMVPGIHFNFDFWTCNTPVRSTYPACRAILAAMKQRNLAGHEMLQAIQAVYYQNAKNPSLSETLIECAQEIGLDTAQFRIDLLSDEIDIALKQEIQLAHKLKAFSFPTLRLIHAQKLYPITVAYLDYQEMLNEINAVVGCD